MFVECHSACKGCTQYGADKCTECSGGYRLTDNTCTGENSNGQNFTYIGTVCQLLQFKKGNNEFDLFFFTQNKKKKKIYFPYHNKNKIDQCDSMHLTNCNGV